MARETFDKCRSCGASIVWATSKKTGKAMPLDAQPVPDGSLALVKGVAHAYTEEDATLRRDRYRSHFSTCVDAGQVAQAEGDGTMSTTCTATDGTVRPMDRCCLVAGHEGDHRSESDNTWPRGPVDHITTIRALRADNARLRALVADLTELLDAAVSGDLNEEQCRRVDAVLERVGEIER